MANDNKKINDLVADNDDDTTELEVLSATVVFDSDLDRRDYLAESDAATHSFESLAGTNAPDDEAVAALKSDLKERENRINSLQYDIEDLRTRWTGLEKELRAREVLTENVTAELEQTNRKLAQTISLLKKRDSRIGELEAAIGEQSAKLAEADALIGEARHDAEAAQAEIDALSERERTAAATLEALSVELDEEIARRSWAEDVEKAQNRLIRQLEEQQDETKALIASLQQYIDGRKAGWERQDADLAARTRSLKEQRKEVRRLTRGAKAAAAHLRKEQAENHKLLAERDQLRAGLESARAEARKLAIALAANERSGVEQQDRIASLSRQFDEAALALQQERQHRECLVGDLHEHKLVAEELQERCVALQDAAVEREALLAARSHSLASLSGQLDATAAQLTSMETDRKELDAQLRAVSREMEQLRAEREASFADLEAKDRLIERQRQDLAELSGQMDALQESFDAERSARESLSMDHATLEAERARLRDELAGLREVAESARLLEAVNAELAGLVASHDDTIKDLGQRLSASESYADSLRATLQQQFEAVEALTASHADVDLSLADALERASRLAAELESERTQRAASDERAAELENRHAEEIRTIRFELGAAEATVAENQALNEQLAHDLLDNRNARQSLENELEESGEARRKEIDDLSRQVAEFRKQIDDYETRLNNKNAAINALLSELARKPQPQKDQGDDDVVHLLPERKPPADDEVKPAQEKDRVTRLLIGSIDGQELRFPLFKDKLTIGRTVHNDIQLKAQYISRRHAVVVTEGDQTRIVDWGSKNGIYVNGRRVSEFALKNGDCVTVGTAEFKFEERPKR